MDAPETGPVKVKIGLGYVVDLPYAWIDRDGKVWSFERDVTHLVAIEESEAESEAIYG